MAYQKSLSEVKREASQLAEEVISSWRSCVKDSTISEQEYSLLKVLIEGACAKARLEGQVEGYGEATDAASRILGNWTKEML